MDRMEEDREQLAPRSYRPELIRETCSGSLPGNESKKELEPWRPPSYPLLQFRESLRAATRLSADPTRVSPARRMRMGTLQTPLSDRNQQREGDCWNTEHDGCVQLINARSSAKYCSSARPTAGNVDDARAVTTTSQRRHPNAHDHTASTLWPSAASTPAVLEILPPTNG